MKVTHDRSTLTLTIKAEHFLEEILLKNFLENGRILTFRITDWTGKDRGIELPIRVVSVTISGITDESLSVQK